MLEWILFISWIMVILIYIWYELTQKSSWELQLKEIFYEIQFQLSIIFGSLEVVSFTALLFAMRY